MKAHKEFKNELVTCLNCNKKFHPRYSSFSMYCSQQCCREYKSKTKYQDYLNNPDKYYGRTNMSWVKKYILKEQECKCAICKNDNTWNGKSLVFILDHIDGHAYNNSRDNLRLICPNCDSQLDTYKSKNKNSDRLYYKFNHR